MKTIGVLTSGGDSPGMNACIVAMARRAEMLGLKTVGILRGFEGFVNGAAVPLDALSVSGIVGRGGTMLQTSRNGDLRSNLEASELERIFYAIGIDALAVLGGGGSMLATKLIADAGLPVVGIPCTIDNDIMGTDYTIGFDTACNKVISATNDIVDTAESLEGRVFLIETLGGDTGHIAVESAYAIGADAVFVPEVETELSAVCKRIKMQMDTGKPYAVIVIAEGAGPAQKLVDPIAELVGRRIRATALGHAQRGGSPTYWDRKLAREFGERALQLLVDGECDSMVSFSGGSITEVPLSVAATGKKPLDVSILALINSGVSPKAEG